MFDFDFIVQNCEAIKTQYQRLLSPFFNAKRIYKVRQIIYKSDLSLYKKDLLWEMLNDDVTIEEFKEIAKSKD